MKPFNDVAIDMSEFMSQRIRKKETFLAPWLTEQSITLVSGYRGVGKTFFALGVCDAVSRGESFGPWNTDQRAPVMFVDGEMPAVDLQERMQKMNGHLRDDESHYYKVYSDSLANDWGYPRASLNSPRWCNEMKEYLVTRGIKFWVLDNIASLTPGIDENLKKDWDPVNKWLLDLRFNGVSTMLLHHVSKEGSQRGTSAREDNIDTSIVLKKPSDYSPEEGCKFVVKFTKSRVRTNDLHAISDTKLELTEENGKYVWTHGSMRAVDKRLVLVMIAERESQGDIARALDITQPRVSQIKRWAIKEGYLRRNKLTQSGESFIGESL